MRNLASLALLLSAGAILTAAVAGPPPLVEIRSDHPAVAVSSAGLAPLEADHAGERPPPAPVKDLRVDPLLGLSVTKTSRGAFVYYANKTASPLVYLHGMCGHPMHMCPWLRDAAGPLAMVCPAATAGCGPGAHIWAGSPEARAAEVDGALEATGHARSEKAIVVGFSQGGYLAADLARLRPGRYRAAWIVGADPKLDVATLRKAGVARLVLSAGDFDGTAAGLRESAKRLSARGYPARYVGLGKVGHAFPLDSTPTPAAIVAWLDGREDWLAPKTAAVPDGVLEGRD